METDPFAFLLAGASRRQRGESDEEEEEPSSSRGLRTKRRRLANFSGGQQHGQSSHLQSGLAELSGNHATVPAQVPAPMPAPVSAPPSSAAVAATTAGVTLDASGVTALINLATTRINNQQGGQSSSDEGLREQNRQLLEIIRLQEEKEKARQDELSPVEPENTDRSWWLQMSNATITDNSADVLDWRIRGKLRNPNLEGDNYWSEVPVETEPVRGSSLYLHHLLGSDHPNPITIR